MPSNNYHGIFGYTDDNWVLAPSLGSLQDMLTTCENYAKCHNLKFSTDPDPVKCKTKLMAFMKRPRQLPNLILCGVSLPWVNKIKHLGNIITNTMDGYQMDTKVKLAKYVDRCNSLNQEFHYAHPFTMIKLNSIYNSHHTGSQLWDLGSREVEKLVSSYNKSIKIMFDLPWSTHRYFIEPLSQEPHLLKQLYIHFGNRELREDTFENSVETV